MSLPGKQILAPVLFLVFFLLAGVTAVMFSATPANLPVMILLLILSVTGAVLLHLLLRPDLNRDGDPGLLSSLFEFGEDGVYLIDRSNGRLLEANPALERMTGYDRNHLLGLNSMDLFPPDEIPRARDVFVRHTQVDMTGAFSGHHVRKNGSLFPVNLDTHVTRWKGGEAIRVRVRVAESDPVRT